MKLISIGTVLSIVLPNILAFQNQDSETPQCRCFPGDPCWPTPQTWSNFNKTINGRLVATIPLGSPCHDDTFSPYNAEACSYLQTHWEEPQLHYESSSSVMAPFFANQSCDPFLPRTARCVLGTYVSYAVNVTGARDISKTLVFAAQSNIRLVVRNTGHDYNGKSTGAGAIALWMHHLKDIEFLDYQSLNYTGKAIKIGAGVQMLEAYDAADAKGFSVVGGECPTVGLAGGYVQGGGHSSLSSKYGLAADQVLEWEVIDGTGKVQRASRSENSDLFWALSGGGGGTFGVVTAVTSKVHLNVPVSGANLTFSNQGITQDQFYHAISTFHQSLPSLVDAGAAGVWFFSNSTFELTPLTAPNVSASQLQRLMSPLTNELDRLNVTYASVFRQFTSFASQYHAMQMEIPVGIGQYAGRFIPRSIVQEQNDNLTDAFRYINENGGEIAIVGLSVSKAVAGNVYNSVNPAWRNTLLDVTISTPWNNTAPLAEMVANQIKMTTKFIPRLAALTPGGGAYLNEGDLRQPNFQEVFYGANYERLLSIKNKYDPYHILYAVTAVGSEYWSPDSEGRLCKT